MRLSPSLSSWMLLLALCVCGLTGCAPTSQPFQPAQEPPHLGATHFTADDGATLPLRSWQADHPHAILLALHGFNDYSHAFEDAGAGFAKSGITVYAYDQRGFGETASHGVWAGNANLERDVAAAVHAIHAAHPGLPVYLLGESMGGAVTVATLADHPLPGVQGAILSAPALWGSNTLNGFYRGTLWLGAHMMPGATVTGRNLHILASDNIPMLRALGHDPLVIKATRLDAIYGLVGLMDHAYDSVPKVKTKLLLLYGANDQIIPRPAILAAADRFTAPLTVAFYPDGFHMLLRDLRGALVQDDITHWIDGEALPSGNDRDWKHRLRHAPPPKQLIARRKIGRTGWRHRSAVALE